MAVPLARRPADLALTDLQPGCTHPCASKYARTIFAAFIKYDVMYKEVGGRGTRGITWSEYMYT